MKQGSVAVEGLDKLGVPDKHFLKPKAKKSRANRPRLADKETLGYVTCVHRNGSSDSCAQDALPNFSGDTAPTPAVIQCSTMGVDISDGQKRKGGGDGECAQVRKKVFIQPAETIPHAMLQRGDATEDY